MKLDSNERKQVWSALLKEGDNLHNCEVLQCDKIPVYKTQKDRLVEDCVPFPVCHGLYKKSICMFSDVGKSTVSLLPEKGRQR